MFSFSGTTSRVASSSIIFKRGQTSPQLMSPKLSSSNQKEKTKLNGYMALKLRGTICSLDFGVKFTHKFNIILNTGVVEVHNPSSQCVWTASSRGSQFNIISLAFSLSQHFLSITPLSAITQKHQKYSTKKNNKTIKSKHIMVFVL